MHLMSESHVWKFKNWVFACHFSTLVSLERLCILYEYYPYLPAMMLSILEKHTEHQHCVGHYLPIGDSEFCTVLGWLLHGTMCIWSIAKSMATPNLLWCLPCCWIPENWWAHFSVQNTSTFSTVRGFCCYCCLFVLFSVSGVIDDHGNWPCSSTYKWVQCVIP